MPVRRAPEDSGRPPLARGSACHRCFIRKVRCSGQPDPATGMHACSACLRTARFKGHELVHCRCAFGSEGLCSEEGGPNLLGEYYPNTGPAPRRKLTSRSSTSSSNRSMMSTSSSNVTDGSFASSSTSLHPYESPLVSPISPPASVLSVTLKSLPNVPRHESFCMPAPAPGLYQQAMSAPLALEMPPALPPYASAPPPIGVTQAAFPPTQPLAPWPQPQLQTGPQPPAGTSPGFAAGTSFPYTPRSMSPAREDRWPQQQTKQPQGPPMLGADTCSKSLLARRVKARPMSIALPPLPGHAASSSVESRPGTRPPSPIRPDDAPMPARLPDHQHAHPHRNESTSAAPDRSAILTQGPPLPLQSCSSYMSGAPSPGWLFSIGGVDSSLHLPLDDRHRPSGHMHAPHQSLPQDQVFAATKGMDAYPGFAAPMETSSVDSYSIAAATTAATAEPMVASSPMPPPSQQQQQQQQQPGAAPNANLGFDLSEWTGSFHLFSPGLTFSSSTPHWFSQAGQTQYFQPA